MLSGIAGGGGGFGGGGFGGARGTPRAGFNTACARNFGGGQGGAPGGTSGGFQGLRGTVDSATNSNLTFDDAQGQTYSVAITSATTIEKTATGQASDLKVGESVSASDQKTSGQIAARNVTIQAS